MGGEQAVVVRKPGITTAMKLKVSYSRMHERALTTCGWGLSESKQDIFDPTSHIFSGKLPLKYLMGFAEDYTKGILNVKQELILIIARSFQNCYMGEVDAQLEITKIEWKIRHIMSDDRPIDYSDNKAKDATKFIHADINSIRLYLNATVYPYERWNLDFSRKLYAAAYYAYENFQSSYYGKEMNEPMMDFAEFLNDPLFVIDCSHQADAMKSSTVDIKLEFDTRKNKFPENTKVYALILHDTCLQYNTLDGTVQIGSVF
ncbi:hypothetical protein NQ315_015164 [Exocentrus adspersus]|uniref:Double jelly roll-like domain-containing protein n=1 Tax=Exocentrus adspersus TaxID=1586481 RepID=A0AAV8V4X8_9CUCU|nr:hypothetical protein NQ315_015164 [Exocentrus adspersus]